MRPSQIFIALLFGGVVVFQEVQPVKEVSLFSGLFDALPFWGLCLLTVIFLAVNLKQYSEHKQIALLLPFCVCILSLFVTLWHQQGRENEDNLPSNFEATTYDIGSDGGLLFDFKKNGHLKAEKRDHWSVTYYWGHYSQKKDTVYLDIPLDFKLSRKAILTRDSLHFMDDTARFLVFRH